jgi:glycosyltransferase involved in cell wall biosynthesis
MNTIVSVIVPTKNSAQFLELCLSSIKKQSYKAIELIVVDNYSTDETSQIAKKYSDQFFEKGPERSAQRNFGVLSSRGEYVLVIDSDMVLDSDVVLDCVNLAKDDPHVKAVVIPESSVGKGFWSKCKALERSCYVGDDTIEAARFFEKEILLQFGGYDEEIHGGGEDWDLPERIKDAGHKIGRIKHFINHLEGHLKLSETMLTKYYYGKTIGIYIGKQPVRAKRKLKIFRPAFFRHWRTLLVHPILTMGMFFMKLCEFAAGGMGFLNSKIRSARI